MKIVSTGNTISSPEFQERKRRAKRKRRFWWTVGLIIFISLFIFVARRPQLQVSAVVVEGADTVRDEDVVSIAEAYLNGSYLGIIPHANALILPRRSLTETLMERFPRFNSLSLTLEGLRVLRISVSEREPFALYCESALSPTDAKACYFIDSNGLIFDEAPAFSGRVYFIYALEKPLEEPLGKEYLPPQEFQKLARFVGRLPSLGLTPLSLEMREGEFSLVLPRNAHLVWKRDADFSLVYANLEAFLTSEAIKGEEDFLDRVSLLDLRTENKVFYRFQE